MSADMSGLHTVPRDAGSQAVRDPDQELRRDESLLGRQPIQPDDLEGRDVLLLLPDRPDNLLLVRKLQMN